MATHTHFFWESLTDGHDEYSQRPGLNTTRSIESDFESPDHLRSEFLETADSLFGNGFVWLMKPPTRGGLTILATYNAGSPYPEAAPRRDRHDSATFNARMLAAGLKGTPYDERGARVIADTSGGLAGKFGEFSAARASRYAGWLDAQPILCVNLWQHQWIPDWGIFGRRQYLAAWWDRIDWSVVEKRHSMYETEGDRLAPNRLGVRSGGLVDAVSRGMSF